MESKKKKKIAIIVAVLSLVLIVAILSVFFIVQNVNKNKSQKNNASNVNYTSYNDRLFLATKAIIEEQVSQNYNGNFVFKDVLLNIHSFHKDLDFEQITTIVKSKGASDINGLRKLLYEAKSQEVESNKEIISLKNGRYTKTYYNSIVMEKGLFYGNDDLSEVRIKKNGQYKRAFDISLNIDEQKLISSTINTTNPTGTKLYVYREFYSNTDDKLVLFTATYVYEMVVDNSKPIPDSKLDFDIKI